MNDWLTIAEASRKTGIPERTIRRYINQHGGHLSTKKQHRSYLVASDALPILIQIRDYYAAGLDAERVEEALARSGVPMTITVAGNDNVTVTAAEALENLRHALAEAVAAIASEQKRMAQELEDLRAEFAATRKLLEKQEEERRKAEAERDRLLEERDGRLVEEMRRMLQGKKRPWWKFW